MNQKHIRSSHLLLIVTGILVALGGLTYTINGLTQPVAQIPVDLVFDDYDSTAPLFDSVEIPAGGYVKASQGMFVVMDNSWLVKLANKNIGVGLLMFFLGTAALLRGTELIRSPNPRPRWRWSGATLFISALAPLLLTTRVDTAVLELYAPTLTASAREPLLGGLVFTAIGAYLLWYSDEHNHAQEPKAESTMVLGG